jgi:hypothetical protein
MTDAFDRHDRKLLHDAIRGLPLLLRSLYRNGDIAALDLLADLLNASILTGYQEAQQADSDALDHDIELPPSPSTETEGIYLRNE